MIILIHCIEFEPDVINRELESVSEWCTLGISLGFSLDNLNVIRQDVGSEGTMQCRLATVTQWYNRGPNVSWPDLIRSLMLMGRTRLAHKLALKYRESVAIYILIYHVHVSAIYR